MKNKLFVIGMMIVVVFLCFVMIYSSFKWIYNYAAVSDEKICLDINSTLIDGQCYSEHYTPVNERRNMLLVGGIGFVLITILLVISVILIKSKNSHFFH